MLIMLLVLFLLGPAARADSTHSENCVIKAKVLQFQKMEVVTKLKIAVTEVDIKGDPKDFPQCLDKKGKVLDLKLNYIVGKPSLGKVYPLTYNFTEEKTEKGSKSSESWRLDISE